MILVSFHLIWCNTIFHRFFCHWLKIADGEIPSARLPTCNLQYPGSAVFSYRGGVANKKFSYALWASRWWCSAEIVLSALTPPLLGSVAPYHTHRLSFPFGVCATLTSWPFTFARHSLLVIHTIPASFLVLWGMYLFAHINVSLHAQKILPCIYMYA